MESAFLEQLTSRQPGESGRRWIFVPYDQLSDRMGPLSREDPREVGIVVVENPWKAAQRPYHRQKLALVLANLRQFALEQAARGVAVRHVVARGPYRSALRPLAAELGSLRVMRPAERELRMDLAPLLDEGSLVEERHEGWLTDPEDFLSSQAKGPPYRMDAFYRHVRRRSGILMENGKPVGGKYSFDADNRKPWKGVPPAPDPPRFSADDVTGEVIELVNARFARHPGSVDPSSLPATRQDATELWTWAKTHCLEHFGPFEDAMSTASAGLFHTRISPLVNLHRLLPGDVLRDVLDLELPLASQEGFVRQLIGWREFVCHVHEATDGFRSLPGGEVPQRDRPGDGGWAGWSGQSWPLPEDGEPADGGADPSFLGTDRDVPPAWWEGGSGLECLDRVVGDVWREGWSHHITRLMVLSNLATLLGISGRDLTDWFWAAYIDAFDWVVEPNVLAMGTFATGPVMTTKPYVSGAAYISRMSDYCTHCAFDPKRTCPVTRLYWDFLSRQADVLADNPRMRIVLNSLKKRAPEQKVRDRVVADWAISGLTNGSRLSPDELPSDGD
jgi:deoxyribodipyrimidine photolyase-related protein